MLSTTRLTVVLTLLLPLVLASPIPTPAGELVDLDTGVSFLDANITRAEHLNKGTMGTGMDLGGGSVMPPSRRSSAPKAKRSSLTTTDTEPKREFVIRLINPRDGSGLGVISLPGEKIDGNDDDDSVNFDPNTGRAMKFAFGPGHQNPDQPFEIIPSDEGVFGRPALLAAVGRAKPCILSEGSPDFAVLGMGRQQPSGLLGINLPLDLASPSGSGSGSGILEPILELAGMNDNDGQRDPAQSAIWTLDPESRRLFAKYLNSNGASTPTRFVTGGGCQHTICLSADVEAFKQYWGDDALEVHLFAGIL